MTVDRGGAFAQPGVVIDLGSDTASDAEISPLRALDHLSVGIVVGDAAGRVTYANRTWYALTGQSPTTEPDEDWLGFLDAEPREKAAAAILAMIARGGAYRTRWLLRPTTLPTKWLQFSANALTAEPAPVDLDITARAGFVGVLSNITADRMIARGLAQRATIDGLTGLLNRSGLINGAMRFLRRRRRDGDYGVAVLYIDVDGLKEINDRHGHAAGDALLIAVADAMRRALRPFDTCGRLGGDEFAAVCPGVQNREDAAGLADRFLTAMHDVIRNHVIDVRIGASVGVVFSDDPDESIDALINRADQAMYQAKAGGGGRFVVG
jgi:diguanylate cyclase (GGDEF)-like protein